MLCEDQVMKDDKQRKLELQQKYGVKPIGKGPLDWLFDRIAGKPERKGHRGRRK